MENPEDFAEAVSDLLARKEELKPIGKELVESLGKEQRKELADALTEMTLDLIPSGYKNAEIGPNTEVAIPPEVAEKSGNPELTAEDLYHVEWARDWARAMYEMATGEEPSKEDIMRMIREKLLPEVRV